jgi:hypothetical protein
MREPETTYTEADVQLVMVQLAVYGIGLDGYTEGQARTALGALLKAGWLPSSASRGLCGNQSARFIGIAQYSCDLLADHPGMHGAYNEDGETRCHWWTCTCPDATQLGAAEPEVHAGGNPRCPIHGNAPDGIVYRPDSSRPDAPPAPPSPYEPPPGGACPSCGCAWAWHRRGRCTGDFLHCPCTVEPPGEPTDNEGARA